MAALLLVDDDPATIAWMVPALEGRGHEARAFTSSREALGALEGWTPDLIISDILMPELDGLAFARLARRLRGVPVLFVSIARREADAVLAGALGYLQKPATASELRAAVDSVLGRRAERNTILIVDDEEDVRELYRTFLEPRFVVVDAEHGEAALAVMESRRIDLAIIDLHMPVMNGVNLIRAMRASPQLQAIPVIVQTSDRSALAAPVWPQ